MIEAPLCGCGAGICRLDVVTNGGPNFGRKFYVCPIKKGQGACNYFVWQDVLGAPGLRLDETVISPVSTLTNSIIINPTDNDIVEDSQPINLGQDYTSQCSNKLLNVKSDLLKRNKVRLVELKGSEDTSDEDFKIHSKRIRLGESKSDGSPSGSSSMSPIIPSEDSKSCLKLASSPTFETDLHPGQMRSRKQCCKNEGTATLAACEDFLSSIYHCATLLIDYEILRDTCWISAAIHDNLRIQIRGWWGRLAFPPSKCLTELAQKPFFCCVFPSFDPIFVPPSVYLIDEAASLAGGNAAGAVCCQGNSIMKKFVSKAFLKAAEQLETDLLNVLRPLEPKDHEIMTQEAIAAFNALDSLGIDSKKFREQVKKFILSASLLAKIEQSISSNHSCQKFTDRFNYQKLKFREVKDAEAKAVNALSVSRQRAAFLAEEICSLKDKLYEAEAELCCCKAESTALEGHVSQMSRDKMKAKQSLVKACNKLKNAWKLRKLMEAEKQAAKTAFEQAKVCLWG